MREGNACWRSVCRGFTLIELMIVVAIVSILATLSAPSLADYVRRSRVPAGLTELSVFQMRMEQRFQDLRSYVDGSVCAAALPSNSNFVFECTTSKDGLAFEALAVGTGQLKGYRYAIDHNGRRTTLAHPRGVPPTACWSVKGTTCDI